MQSAYREAKGLPNKQNADELFHWWIEDPNIYGQMSIWDYLEENENIDSYVDEDDDYED